jgi:hypothetical protein
MTTKSLKAEMVLLALTRAPRARTNPQERSVEGVAEFPPVSPARTTDWASSRSFTLAGVHQSSMLPSEVAQPVMKLELFLAFADFKYTAA